MDTLFRATDKLRQELADEVILESAVGGEGIDLLPEELAVTDGWAPHRRAQFAIGRMLAHRALRHLGYNAIPILSGREGEPLWPPGVVGSISHKREHCIVVVATSGRFQGVGVDLEHDGYDSAEAELIRRVCPTQREQAQATRLATTTASPGTLFLAAKEAFFKFQFPTTRTRLDWDDVEVSFETPNVFTASRIGPVGQTMARGAYVVTDGWILTAIM